MGLELNWHASTQPPTPPGHNSTPTHLTTRSNFSPSSSRSCGSNFWLQSFGIHAGSAEIPSVAATSARKSQAARRTRPEAGSTTMASASCPTPAFIALAVAHTALRWLSARFRLRRSSSLLGGVAILHSRTHKAMYWPQDACTSLESSAAGKALKQPSHSTMVCSTSVSSFTVRLPLRLRSPRSVGTSSSSLSSVGFCSSLTSGSASKTTSQRWCCAGHHPAATHMTLTPSNAAALSTAVPLTQKCRTSSQSERNTSMCFSSGVAPSSTSKRAPVRRHKAAASLDDPSNKGMPLMATRMDS
mmetsp:Transcript_21247/g.46629  ORF Transcript_21247/g.46629 Transcript_21247/m.46629 type:complete len:301 (+) Transcript_21247:185-1087(+)